ncbi:MAG: carbon monoxide dehydrogenase subunit G [Chloroflexaceae bacterium]|nr:carbon monoxide dehydrogenase subunit G [Chloroflexaceae bacterium]
MRIAGNYTFEATRDEVWSAINDPEVLARTIPGCQKLEQVGENEYESTLKIGLQAVKGVYSGRVRIEDIVTPLSYKIAVDGKGSNGFMKGSGAVNLREDGATTILDYGGEAQVGGTIASVGQRLLDGAAKTLINQSLKALAEQIAQRRAGPVAPAAAETPASANGMVSETATLVAAAATPAAVAVAAEAPAALAEAASAPVAPAAPASHERRTIVVPPHEQLSDRDVAFGVMEDFLKERPWFAWVVVAFLVGLLLGRRKR